MLSMFLVILGTASTVTQATLTVSPGGDYTAIQAAIDAASPGDTILVNSGTYPGDLHVTKSLTLKGVDTGSGQPVIFGSGNGDVITLEADGVTLEGLVIKNSEKYSSALEVKSNDNTITRNTITGSDEAIHIEYGNRNTVTDNTLTGNTGDGIYIHYSDGNTITHNYAENNQFGIQGDHLKGNVIADNDCKDNSQIDLYVENIADSVIQNNRIESNEQASRNGGDGIGMRYGTNVTIKGNTVGKHYYGIKVYYSSNVVVADNSVQDSGVNIRFDFGTDDSVIRNNTVRNGIDNILISGEGKNNLVEANTVSTGKDSIYLFSAGSNNTVRHNNVYNSTYGIRLYKSTGNTITQNYLHDNQDNIYPGSTGNTASDNTDRANFYGKAATSTPKATATAKPGKATATPTATPMTDSGQNDVISWILGIIGGLFGQG